MQSIPEILEIGRWGKGLVTTDLHGDIAAFKVVEKIFRTTKQYRWWLDLGDKMDSEKNRMVRSRIPLSGDRKIYDRVHQLSQQIATGSLKKRFLEIKGNHDQRNLMLWEMLERNDLLSKRQGRSLNNLLEEVARREDWPRTQRYELDDLWELYPKWLQHLRLELPGLSKRLTALKFLIEKIYCQHGFVLRMRSEDARHMRKVTSVMAYFTKAGIIATHGGICTRLQNKDHIQDLEPEEQSEFYWNRYGSNYHLPHLRKFLKRLGAQFLITGHTPLEDILLADPQHSSLQQGVVISSNKLLTFSSSYGAHGGQRVYLEIDSNRVYTHPEQIKVHRIPAR